MGLDQYLNMKKTYSDQGWTTKNSDENIAEIYKKVVDAVGVEEKLKTNSIDVEYNVMYWRKANQIHSYFVRNYAQGVDDCKPMRIPRTGLVRLAEICGMLLESKSEVLADELLPPLEGFFFGTTGIDEWYWASVEETFNELTEILSENPENWFVTFTYEASW